MVKMITPKELFGKIKSQQKLVVVDVRAEDKYNNFHIEDEYIEDINIPKTEIFKLESGSNQVIPQIPANKEMIITCTTGNSATRCAGILSENGYDVMILEGGITAWKNYISNESVTAMWEEYKRIHSEAPEHYEAWAFGDSKEMADELAELVVKGVKTATASNYILYETENESLPKVGLHNIILDGDGIAVAIVETTSVEVIPFDEVTEEHAYMEGEGDRSLRYWREVHETFFTNELEKIKQKFHDTIPIVCEKFQLIHKK